MDGGILQQRIQYGYGKCAQFIGAPFLLYRATNPINPISTKNIVGIIKSSANINWEYNATQKYGKAVWNLIINTQQTNSINIYAQPGDYLLPVPGYYPYYGGLNNYISSGLNDVGALLSNDPNLEFGWVEDPLIYYVAATNFLQPILGVNCNRKINIIRPTQTIGAGFQGYAEYLPSTSTMIMSGMPASILEMSQDGKAETKLPTDTNQPRWIILIPNLGDIIVRVDDIVVDDLNQEYVVTDNELTFLGWRILAEQVVNSR
jgi:hypothetical protein